MLIPKANSDSYLFPILKWLPYFMVLHPLPVCIQIFGPKTDKNSNNNLLDKIVIWPFIGLGEPSPIFVFGLNLWSETFVTSKWVFISFFKDLLLTYQKYKDKVEMLLGLEGAVSFYGNWKTWEDLLYSKT